MPVQPNSNYAINPSDKVIASSGLILTQPYTLATQGTFQIPDGAIGDIEFAIQGLTTETMAVTMSPDGVNFSAALKPVLKTTGKDSPTAALTFGYYTLPVLRFGSPKFLKFTKSATVEAAVIAIAVPTVSRMW